jgi:hypothetical protein
MMEDEEDVRMHQRQAARWTQLQQFLKDSGCFEVNQELEKCMDQNDRAWRMCKDHTEKLKQCMMKSMLKKG